MNIEGVVKALAAEQTIVREASETGMECGNFIARIVNTTFNEIKL